MVDDLVFVLRPRGRDLIQAYSNATRRRKAAADPRDLHTVVVPTAPPEDVSRLLY